MQKDEREKARENFRESALLLSNYAQSSQKICVRRQTRNRRLLFRVLRKLVERKRVVDVQTRFLSLQIQRRAAIDYSQENQFEKEEGNNTDGRFFEFLADARHCSSR